MAEQTNDELMDDVKRQAMGEVLDPEPVEEKPSVSDPEELEDDGVGPKPPAEVLVPDGSSWLEDYIDFSRKWSPRAYDDFHEACALWLLSTVAAGRLIIHLGKPRHTHLYILLVARTSLYAKSTTAEIAIQVLKEIGLAHLLMPDSATPAKFITIMAQGSVEIRGTKITFASAQRGWYYEEFGQHVAAMLKPGGFMSDFLFMLRKFDDDKGEISYSTLTREDVIENPYLALLATLTPDDLRPYAKKGSVLWGDGFLARFALVCPPEALERCKDPFPKGKRRIPPSILKQLRSWDKRLGDGITTIKMTKSVRSAFEEYDGHLLDSLAKLSNRDLDGNYAKLSERTLRIAVLLASVAGSSVVSMEYWEKAQEITERWRTGVHELYTQVNEKVTSAEQDHKDEERILRAVQKHLGATARKVYDTVKTKHLSMSDVVNMLNYLVDIAILTTKPGRLGVLKYYFPVEDDA